MDGKKFLLLFGGESGSGVPGPDDEVTTEINWENVDQNWENIDDNWEGGS